MEHTMSSSCRCNRCDPNKGDNFETTETKCSCGTNYFKGATGIIICPSCDVGSSCPTQALAPLFEVT